MKVTETNLPGVYLLEPKVFGDHRGWFMESWSQAKMEAAGLFYNFVQDNHSYSAKKGILRGLHFQIGDAAQAKLVRCCRGAVLDAVADIRPDSSTYRQWYAAELSEENKRQLLVPRGYAHGFLTLTDGVEFLYKTDNFYNAQAERCIRWNDPDIGIKWGCDAPVLIERDANAPFLKEYIESR